MRTIGTQAIAMGDIVRRSRGMETVKMEGITVTVMVTVNEMTDTTKISTAEMDIVPLLLLKPRMAHETPQQDRELRITTINHPLHHH